MELELTDGWVEPELAEELPGLGLVLAPVEVKPRKSPPNLKRRLRVLANRYTGGKVIHMRQDPVPWAYRVFARAGGRVLETKLGNLTEGELRDEARRLVR